MCRKHKDNGVTLSAIAVILSFRLVLQHAQIPFHVVA